MPARHAHEIVNCAKTLSIQYKIEKIETKNRKFGHQLWRYRQHLKSVRLRVQFGWHLPIMGL